MLVIIQHQKLRFYFYGLTNSPESIYLSLRVHTSPL